jgi:Na+-driven multidrug efflux pump
MVLMTPMWGYSSATNSMVSNLIGQNKSCEVIKLVKKIITLSLLTSTILFLINIFDYTMLLQITTSDHQLISDAIPSYHIIWVSMFIFSASIILLSAVSGTGNTRAAMIIEIVNIFIYMGYVYICAVIIKTKLETVWLAEIFYWIIMGVLAYFYLNSRKWIPVTAKNENKIEKEITV